MKTIFAAVIFLLLTACGTFAAFEDGYQFGDVTKTGYLIYKRLNAAKTIYCSESLATARVRLSQGIQTKQEAMATLAAHGVAYDQDGFCAVELKWRTDDQ